MSTSHSNPEVVMDCRVLQQQPRENGAAEPSLLKALTTDGYSPRDRMIGWSYVLAAFGICMFAGGGLMLILALTLETRGVSLAEYYNIHTGVIGVAILAGGCALFLFAYIKKLKHGHL